MKTSEEILEEIKLAIASNNDVKAKCNMALTNATQLILHMERELQNQLGEEYKRGMNDAWEIARELCNTDYDECNEIFGDTSVENVITTYSPSVAKEKIESHREEKENRLNKIHVGDVVQNSNDNTKATILDCDVDIHSDNKSWLVFTENGCVESWCENEFTKTGESVDVCNVLIK